MRKIIFTLFVGLYFMPVLAGEPQCIKFPPEALQDLPIDSSQLKLLMEAYLTEIKNNACSGGISASAIPGMCNTAGIELSKCKNYMLDLLKKEFEYYNVCGPDKGKSVAQEFCIDNVFSDIEVQFAQAKNLAHEYAKLKYKDDIICSKTRSRFETKDDFIACKSKKEKIFYEFKFDDAKESNALDEQFVLLEFARGLCLVYGGKPQDNSGKILLSISDKVSEYSKSVQNKLFGTSTNSSPITDTSCNISSCNELNNSVQKWGYSAQVKQNTCVLSYGGTNQSVASKDYYAKFDGEHFTVYHNDKVVRSYAAVSGRGKKSTDSRGTICQLPQYQACKEIGPTPEGIYYIDQNNIEYAENVTFGNFNSNSPLADKSGSSWGSARVILKPDETTDTFERTSMYVHGGKYRGSAGCIDLTNNIGDFINWFAAQTEFSVLKIIVDYNGFGNEAKGLLCTDCTEKSCSPCKCITDAADCEYRDVFYQKMK